MLCLDFSMVVSPAVIGVPGIGGGELVQRLSALYPGMKVIYFSAQAGVPLILCLRPCLDSEWFPA